MSSCVQGRPGPSSEGLQPLCLSGLWVPISPLLISSQNTSVPVSSWAAFHLCRQLGASVSGGETGQQAAAGRTLGQPEAAGGSVYPAPGNSPA